MRGVLYFPFIEVPETAWFTRTLLYWDQVGTIVPKAYVREPDRMAPFTVELIRQGLVKQVLPEEAEGLVRNFRRFLDRLDEDELERRRRLFAEHSVTRIHMDKFLSVGFSDIELLGLARTVPAEPPRWIEWVQVETTTAAEFMAALALSLCAPGPRWQDDQDGRARTWVPITDRPQAASGLLAGLRPLDVANPERSELSLRVEGDVRVTEIRSALLERLLPVPADPLPLQQVVDFRRRHGDLLPQLRQYLEDAVDQIVMIDDPVMRQRRLDRLVEEAEQRVRQAEAYLREAGVRRIARSHLLRWLKLVPAIAGPAGGIQDIAAGSLKQGDFLREPLAYLAFARTEFDTTERYQVDPMTGVPLVEAMAATLT